MSKKRTESQVEESNASKSVELPTEDLKTGKRKIHPNSLKNLCAPWKPGDCPNPTGKNGRDFAREIAQAVFEQNPELIYKAMVKALTQGNGYVFQVLSDRAFGKITDKLKVDGLEDLAVIISEARKRANS